MTAVPIISIYPTLGPPQTSSASSWHPCLPTAGELLTSRVGMDSHPTAGNHPTGMLFWGMGVEWLFQSHRCLTDMAPFTLQGLCQGHVSLASVFR